MLLVSHGLPITAGVEQTKVAKGRTSRTPSADVIDKATNISTAAEINSVSANSVQNAVHISNGQGEIATEQIRVTSTIGKNQFRGNLTQHKAIEIYEKIARLL